MIWNRLGSLLLWSSILATQESGSYDFICRNSAYPPEETSQYPFLPPVFGVFATFWIDGRTGSHTKTEDRSSQTWSQSALTHQMLRIHLAKGTWNRIEVWTWFFLLTKWSSKLLNYCTFNQSVAQGLDVVGPYLQRAPHTKSTQLSLPTASCPQKSHGWWT